MRRLLTERLKGFLSLPIRKLLLPISLLVIGIIFVIQKDTTFFILGIASLVLTVYYVFHGRIKEPLVFTISGLLVGIVWASSFPNNIFLLAAMYSEFFLIIAISYFFRSKGAFVWGAMFSFIPLLTHLYNYANDRQLTYVGYLLTVIAGAAVFTTFSFVIKKIAPKIAESHIALTISEKKEKIAKKFRRKKD